MAILEFASEDTTQLPLGEGEFLEVRTDLSKSDFNKLLRKLPAGFTSDEGLSPADADDFTSVLFEMLVTGWSANVPATVDNYVRLKRSKASEVDTVLLEHFNSLTPTEEQRSKSKRDSK